MLAVIDIIQNAKEMQMITLDITILVIIFIYFLHVLSSRSDMGKKKKRAMSTWGEKHIAFLRKIVIQVASKTLGKTNANIFHLSKKII